MLHTFSGLFGIVGILGFAYLISNNKKAISWRLVGSGLALQWAIAIFILKVPLGQAIFGWLTKVINGILKFSDVGAGFVFGPLINQPDKLKELFGPGGDFIFAFKVVATIVFVASLVSIAYHIGLMQKVVQVVAWIVSKIMGASGGEALSNVASVFVGQIEAQLMIKPYITTMTQSEVLAIMSGSLACIAGSIMAVYIQMGIPASYLLTASLMAAPGALVIAKMVYPETEESPTRGNVKIELEKTTVNLLDAAAHGASDGLRIGLQVVTMLIAFIALIAMVDAVVGFSGSLLAKLGLSLQFVGLDLAHLTLKDLIGTLFSVIAFALGVPWAECVQVGSLMGTKLVINEFVAYTDLVAIQGVEGMASSALSPKAMIIATFALCGFANFSSVAMQIGGIGEMAPSRKADLARLGMKALLCGTLASYMSSAIAGILISV